MMSRLRAATDELATRDRVMAKLIRRFGYPAWGRKPHVSQRFEYLARSICYQQLAGKAAATIWARTVNVVGGTVTPEAILSKTVRRLRTAGLSENKALAIRDLAAHVHDGRVDLSGLGRRSPERILEELIQVRGIGRWTAEMFMLGALHHLDVWATGDLGIRKGYALAYGLQQVPTEKALEPLGEPLRPYRSIASHYCWRILDDPSNGEGKRKQD